MSEAGSPLKIAHVVRIFAFGEWGGTETVVWNTVLNQKKLGMTPIVFATSALSLPGEEVRDQILIRRFPYRYPCDPEGKMRSDPHSLRRENGGHERAAGP